MQVEEEELVMILQVELLLLLAVEEMVQELPHEMGVMELLI
jgi:hypothetical protein